MSYLEAVIRSDQKAGKAQPFDRHCILLRPSALITDCKGGGRPSGQRDGHGYSGLGVRHPRDIAPIRQVLSQQQIPNFESSLAKTFGTDFEQKLANTAMEILGLSGQALDGPWAPLLGMATRSYLFSPGYSIQGGTSEILKTIIATRGLGLPAGK